jgi:hypothetical protein
MLEPYIYIKRPTNRIVISLLCDYDYTLMLEVDTKILFHPHPGFRFLVRLTPRDKSQPTSNRPMLYHNGDPSYIFDLISSYRALSFSWSVSCIGQLMPRPSVEFVLGI